MATLETQRAQKTGLRAWSRTRWLVISAVLVGIVVAVAVILTYGGGGSGGGGGY